MVSVRLIGAIIGMGFQGIFLFLSTLTSVFRIYDGDSGSYWLTER